jgi:small-conductance mechanosensitive channel
LLVIAGLCVGAVVASTTGAAEAPAPADGAASIPTTIGVASDARSDSRIERRIVQLFAEVQPLSGVQVAVRAGVVTLSGTVSSQSARQQAMSLARRVEDVVDVQDRIAESYDLQQRLSQTLQRVVAQLQKFVAYLPLLAVAMVVLALFWWVAGRVAKSAWIGRRFARNPFMRDLASQGVRVGFVGAGLLLALEVLDATTLVGTVLGAAGVFGLAIGFAMRDTVENYVASLLLSLRQPFARNDHVSVDGCEGRVLRLTARATILMTLDGNHTRIPNAKVYKAVIVNFTRNPKRRFEFDVGVDTEQDLATAQRLAATTLLHMNGVLRDPAPYCTVMELGESNVILRVFGWVDQARVDFNKVRSESIRVVKSAFDRACIVMPEPIYNVRLDRPVAELAAPSAAAAKPPASAESSNEPIQAVDIAPKDDLARQIEDDSQPEDENILSQRAPRE